jgi:hypothetical protein
MLISINAEEKKLTTIKGNYVMEVFFQKLKQ